MASNHNPDKDGWCQNERCMWNEWNATSNPPCPTKLPRRPTTIDEAEKLLHLIQGKASKPDLFPIIRRLLDGQPLPENGQWFKVVAPGTYAFDVVEATQALAAMNSPEGNKWIKNSQEASKPDENYPCSNCGYLRSKYKHSCDGFEPSPMETKELDEMIAKTLHDMYLYTDDEHYHIKQIKALIEREKADAEDKATEAFHKMLPIYEAEAVKKELEKQRIHIDAIVKAHLWGDYGLNTREVYDGMTKYLIELKERIAELEAKK